MNWPRAYFKMGAILCVTAAMAWGSRAAEAGLIYSQGFETDTSGWFDGSNGWNGSITRVASDPLGITSASGSWHAVVTQGMQNGGIEFPPLSAMFVDTGPASNLGGANPLWPGGFTVSTDIYLDISWATGEGFDYSAAILRNVPPDARDFIFHVTQDTSSGSLLVAASNNTNFDPREDLETISHAVIGSSDWYTFEHVFYDMSGILAVDLNLYNSSGMLLFSETRKDNTDLIPSVVGGNAYAWFTNIDIAGGVAIDSASLTYVPEPATLVLWGTGLLGFSLIRRVRTAGSRRQRRAA